MSESLPNPLAVAMSSSSHLQAKSPPTLDPETELIVTEESYVNDSRVLVETFVIPLEAMALSSKSSRLLPRVTRA
jgi:hypothetical protein